MRSGNKTSQILRIAVVQGNKKHHKKENIAMNKKTIQKTNDYKMKNVIKAICQYMLQPFFRPRYGVSFLETTFINYFK